MRSARHLDRIWGAPGGSYRSPDESCFLMTETTLHRIRTRVQTPADVWLGMRMLLWACCLPALKHAVPLPALVRLVAARRRSDATPPPNTTGETAANLFHGERRSSARV